MLVTAHGGTNAREHTDCAGSHLLRCRGNSTQTREVKRDFKRSHVNKITLRSMSCIWLFTNGKHTGEIFVFIILLLKLRNKDLS